MTTATQVETKTNGTDPSVPVADVQVDVDEADDAEEDAVDASGATGQCDAVLECLSVG